MATPRDQCHQHLASQPRERVVALERHSICKLIFTPRPSRCAYRLLPDRTTITRRHRRSAYVPAVADIIVAADAPATVDAVEAAVPAVAKAPAVPAIVDGLVILIFLLQIE